MLPTLVMLLAAEAALLLTAHYWRRARARRRLSGPEACARYLSEVEVRLYKAAGLQVPPVPPSGLVRRYHRDAELFRRQPRG